MTRLISLVPSPTWPGLTALAAALLLSGCVNLAPRYERPAAPVPEHYPDAPADAGSNGAANADVGWRTFFADAKCPTCTISSMTLSGRL